MAALLRDESFDIMAVQDAMTLHVLFVNEAIAARGFESKQIAKQIIINSTFHETSEGKQNNSNSWAPTVQFYHSAPHSIIDPQSNFITPLRIQSLMPLSVIDLRWMLLWLRGSQVGMFF